MRKIILNLCTSLDFYIEGPKGEIDWCFTDQDYGMIEFLESVDTILFGRKSYELQMSLAPDFFSDKKWVVFSKTIKVEDPKITVINSGIKNEVEKIKKSPGRIIWFFGGASLLSEFLRLNLIEEMFISVHPIVLGRGLPLFQNVENRKKLKLINSKSFDSGLVQLHYSCCK